MLISLLVSVMSYQYGPDLAVVYANEAFYAVLQGVLFNFNENELYLQILQVLGDGI